MVASVDRQRAPRDLAAVVRAQPDPGGAGLHAGLTGAFVVATLPGGSRLGYLDDQLRGRVVPDADEVGQLDRTWESLSAVALPRDQSRDLILKVINEYN